MADTSTETRAGLTLLGDAPYAGETDPLDFVRIAGELKELILSSRTSTPFSIGIEASWGMGKSTLMERLNSQLALEKDVVTVWFNAWSAENADVFEGLIKTALAKVDQSVLRRVARDEKFLRGMRLTSSVAAALFRSGDAVDRLWDRFATDAKARNAIRALVNDVMEAWQKKAGRGRGGKLLVIFIDDLDRCSPDTVLHLFETIKIYLDAPGFVFVVGFDELVVSDAILAQKDFSKAITSRHYLEKIIQISYRVPRPDEKQIADLFDVYARESGTRDLFDEPGKDIVIQGSARNPRKIKRFMNGFILDYQSDPQWDELGATLLIKWLILHMYFGEFARLFADEDRDWIEEFHAYHDLWMATRAGNVAADHAGRRVLTERYGLPAEADLETIERSLPEVFQTLVTNRSFVAFLEDFREEEPREQLVRKLRAEPYRAATGAAQGSGMSRTLIADMPVPIVLIVSEDERVIEGLAETLGTLPAEWIQTPPGEMRATVGRVRLDAVIWAGEMAVGLGQIAELKMTRDFKTPVIFYGRVTPEWRERAEKLGARIASDPTSLLTEISTIVRMKWGAELGPSGSAPRYS